MSAFLIAFVGVIYAGIAIEQIWIGNGAMCMIYTGYALANVGLWLLA